LAAGGATADPAYYFYTYPNPNRLPKTVKSAKSDARDLAFKKMPTNTSHGHDHDGSTTTPTDWVLTSAHVVP
jgi:hypothetical protein